MNRSSLRGSCAFRVLLALLAPLGGAAGCLEPPADVEGDVEVVVLPPDATTPNEHDQPPPLPAEPDPPPADPAEPAPPDPSDPADPSDPSDPSPTDPAEPSPTPPDPSDPVDPPVPAEPSFDPAACPRVRITAQETLNVRPSPDTGQAALGVVRSGQIVQVLDRVEGEDIAGVTAWYAIPYLDGTGFVSGAFAVCTTDEAPPLPDGYLLPLACGSTVRIAQGNFGTFSHSGRSRYAYDFSIGTGTPLLAMADGEVIGVYADTGPGDPCFNGGGESCFPYANWVALRHTDGSQSIYKHLNRVDVRLGELLPRGTTVGLSGSTGYSTGPHAHVMRQQDCADPLRCESVPLVFGDVDGDGEPETDEFVTSQNCR
jgi:murein DD-endopeptidase MepM/ murein hydrolase activator NlpD